MAERKKLSDILLNSDRERLTKNWSATKAADEHVPVPSGEYRCRIADGVLFTSKSATPGYKLVLEVAEGDHAGRRLWHDIWLSDAALAMAKRDLAKLGIERPEQLDGPPPDGIIVSAKVVLRRGDDGSEFNRVTRFEVVDLESPEPNPFPPPNDLDTGGIDRQDGDQGEDQTS
jgi:hypothetical protein